MQGMRYEKRDFQPISRNILKKIQDTAIVTMECELKTLANFRMVPF